MQNGPLVSVVVPTYNRCDLLRTTLGTLVQQRFPYGEFEVIVADDGSSDATEEVALSFSDRLRIRYVFQDDLGFRAGEARNAGARLATAPVLAFLDTGTLAGPSFVRGHFEAHDRAAGPRAVIGYCYGYQTLDRQLRPAETERLARALDSHSPEQAIESLGGDPAFSDPRSESFGDDGEALRLLVPWVFFWSMNCSVQADAFWEVGGFDQGFRTWGCEDVELGYQLGHRGLPIVVTRTGWTVEVPSQRSVGANRQNLKRNFLLLLRKHPEPLTELVCSAVLREDPRAPETDYRVLQRGLQQAAGRTVAAEVEQALCGVPAGSRVGVFGCGDRVPDSLEPAFLADFDAGALGAAVAGAGGRHTGYNLIGMRTPLRAGELDVVIITSRLRGVWDDWGDLVTAEAMRIGRDVRCLAAGPVPAR